MALAALSGVGYIGIPKSCSKDITSSSSLPKKDEANIGLLYLRETSASFLAYDSVVSLIASIDTDKSPAAYLFKSLKSADPKIP